MKIVQDGHTSVGPLPLPTVLEVDRTVNESLRLWVFLAAGILGGRRVSIRIEPDALTFFDPDTCNLLRTRSNPFTAEPATPG